MKLNQYCLDGKDAGIDGLAYTGFRHFSKADSPLDNIQDKFIIIHYLQTGKQTLGIFDREYHLRGNDVFVTLPEEVHHSCGRPREKCLLYCLALRKPKTGGYFGFTEKQGQEVWQRLLQIPRRQFQGTPEMRRLFIAVSKLIPAESLFKSARLSCLATEIILLVEELARKDAGPNNSDRLAKVLEYIDQRVHLEIDLKDCATLIGLSSARFRVFFKEGTGVPPQEYILRRKVERAKILLSAPSCNITSVAFALGFASSQYFSTVFRRFESLTPSEYRKAALVRRG